jgi:hypothetical protein
MDNLKQRKRLAKGNRHLLAHMAAKYSFKEGKKQLSKKTMSSGISMYIGQQVAVKT